jgi:hypothetical protein
MTAVICTDKTVTLHLIKKVCLFKQYHHSIKLKSLRMKKAYCFAFYIFITTTVFSQNVGIGIATPLYKLDVAGFVRNSNSTMTSPGLFGRLTSGGSLRIENSDNFKFMVIDGSSLQAQLGSGTGSATSASPLLLNPYGGNVGIRTASPNASLSVLRGNGVDGTAAFFGTQHVSHFNYNIDENTYIRGGKTGSSVYINDTHNGDVNIATGGGNINTGNGIYSTQTGGLNIVPLGIIKYAFQLDVNGNAMDVSVSNEAGSLYTGWGSTTTTGADDRTTFTINLDFAQASGYSKLLAVGSPEFELGLYPIYSATATVNKTGNAASLVIFYEGDCLTCEFSLLAGKGTYMIYGIK